MVPQRNERAFSFWPTVLHSFFFSASICSLFFWFFLSTLRRVYTHLHLCYIISTDCIYCLLFLTILDPCPQTLALKSSELVPSAEPIFLPALVPNISMHCGLVYQHDGL